MSLIMFDLGLRIVLICPDTPSAAGSIIYFFLMFLVMETEEGNLVQQP